MVDVTEKAVTQREAIATGSIQMQPETSCANRRDPGRQEMLRIDSSLPSTDVDFHQGGVRVRRGQ